MDKQFDRDKINQVLNSLSGKLGPDEDKLKAAVKSGNLDKVFNNLSPSDSKKLQQVLSDKAAAQRLLSTPQAQMLLKQILKDKG